MNDYFYKYDTLKKKIIYNFDIGDGGIGDCIKFFIQLLFICIKYNYKLHYLINNIDLEKYIKLEFNKFYISKTDINQNNTRIIKYENELLNINDDCYNIVKPYILYGTFDYNNIISNIQSLFYFSEEVKINSHTLLNENIHSYISLHLRLGDKYLETSKEFVLCKNDTRTYNEEKIFEYIEQNHDKNIIFFCDNNNYKLKIKNKYDNIIITNSSIGHTSLNNTTDKQILDAVTEFYIISNSKLICAASESGFSIIASKMKNVPLVNIK